MPGSGAGRRWLRWPWRSPAAIERDVEEEIRFHLESRTADLMDAGASPAEARERALAEFGDVTALRRALRRTDAQLERRRRWWAWLEDLRQDARFAVRSLARTPGFTAVALATLTLGIGASVAIFTVVNAVLLRPLPYPEPDRLVQVSPGQNFNITMADAVVGSAPALAATTGLSLWQLTLTGEGEPVALTAQFVDAEFFQVFGVRPAWGRAFRPEERDPGLADVVLLSHGLWQTRFGGDPGVIGRRIELDGSQHATRRVIGVMPRSFVAPLVPPGQTVDLWAPLSVAPGRTVATDSTWYVNALVGRMAPGATVERVAREVRVGTARVRSEFGNLIDEETVRSASAAGLLDSQVGDVRRTLWVLLAAVGLVLMLACANLANLLLARGERRRQELAVRAALGARRGRLLRSQLTESAVLALLGGAGGVLAARAILAGLRVAEASALPRLTDLAPDARVLGFALAISLLATIGFGLTPSWHATRADLREDLGSGGRAPGRTRAGRRLGFALVAGEVALAMVLVTGAGLLLGTLAALRAVDSGLDPEDVLAMELTPPATEYAGERGRIFYQRVREELAALPGVRTVGAIQLLPFTAGNWAFPYLAEGHPPPSDAPLPSANFRVITPGYIDAVDLPLLAGRDVETGDGADGVGVGLINRVLAERLWPGESPIGRQIRIFGSVPIEVVGLVGDVHQHALDRAPEPEIYVPQAQWGRVSGMVVMLETAVPPSTLVSAASRAVWRLDPDVPVVNARPLDEVLGESLARRRFFAGVLAFFGGLALLLGAVGVYGVMTYAFGARVPEFGVRLALGATHGAVLRRALLSGLAPVLVGLAAGIGGALAAARLIGGLLYGIAPGDPRTLALAALVLGLVAIAASWLPAYRVTRVDPAKILRSE